jgi:ribosomal protein S18 acetylase RimI-like enzyme
VADQPYTIEPLDKHDRRAFSCGSEPLDRYFKTQVTQDTRRRVAKCLVAVEVATGDVAGFYTLSATTLGLADLSDAMARTLPRYPIVPAVLMGRLAVSTKAQGHKLGTAMLAHAVEYVATSNIGAFGLVVDAKDDAAQRFYERHGFVIIKERQLILPLETALKVLGLKAS